MARRRSDFDKLGPIVQIGLLMAFACAFLPPFRTLVRYALLFGLAVLVLVLLVRVALTCEQRSDKLDDPVERHATGTQPPEVSPKSHLYTIDELIEQSRAIDWYQFEKLVEAIYRKLGYRVTHRGGANPDGGIDLIMEKDWELIAVQCKHWKTRDVGVAALRDFLGALTNEQLKKGIFVTLGGYTGAAKQFAEKNSIEIVNESGLALLLESACAGSDPEILAVLQDTRKICPRCEREMVERTAMKGPGEGQKFWGCSAYPHCRYTMPAD